MIKLYLNIHLISHDFHTLETGAKTCTTKVEDSNNEVMTLLHYLLILFHFRPFEPSYLALEGNINVTVSQSLKICRSCCQCIVEYS